MLRIVSFSLIAACLGLGWLIAPEVLRRSWPSDDPVAAVKALYADAARWRLLWWRERAPFGASAEDQALLAPWLRARWLQTGGVPFDIVTMSSGTRVVRHEVRVISQIPRRTVVAATFTTQQRDGDRRVEYAFVRRPKSKVWKLEDVRGTRDGAPWSLAQTLAASLGTGHPQVAAPSIAAPGIAPQ